MLERAMAYGTTMSATNKAALCRVTEIEFAKLDRLMPIWNADVARFKDADDTPIEDVVGHRAHWIELFLGW